MAIHDQGAPRGAYEYVVKGGQIGGFAVVGYPATYGNPGAMNFMVNHDRGIYEKDLGKDTARLAAAIDTFNPDKTWRKAE